MIPGTSRGIRLIDETPPGMPLIGRVAAGSPILATEHVEDYVAVDPSFFKPRADYLLEVCLLYTSPSPRDRSLTRMPSSA